MKILEKLVYEQFISFILENDINHHNQSGFRHSYSTSSAALYVKEYIVNSLKSRKFACAVLIDLSKAFDTVDHKILLRNCSAMVSKTYLLHDVSPTLRTDTLL